MEGTIGILNMAFPAAISGVLENTFWKLGCSKAVVFCVKSLPNVASLACWMDLVCCSLELLRKLVGCSERVGVGVDQTHCHA